MRPNLLGRLDHKHRFHCRRHHVLACLLLLFEKASPTQKPCDLGMWLSAAFTVRHYARDYRHRHSGIKFVTPHQRHSGSATAICQQRADVYETARQANPTRWSRSTRCWRQPEEVWINKPTEEPDPIMALPLIQAA